MPQVDLSQYKKRSELRTHSLWVELLWILVQAVLVSSFQPWSALRIAVLRLFGAGIGKDVTIKPYVRIKFPWKLQIGDHTWLGEQAWIDNLDHVSIGSHCCISQGVYICTGNHDWKSSTFALKTAPVTIQDNVWLCANSMVAPGVNVGAGAVLTFGSVATGALGAWEIHSGNPAHSIGKRSFDH